MAGFRKRPAEGENARFTAITPNGIAYDPTEGPPSGSMGSMRPLNRDTSRWGQWDRGAIDNAGDRHDY